MAIARKLYGAKFELVVKILYFINLWCGNVLTIILVTMKTENSK